MPRFIKTPRPCSQCGATIPRNTSYQKRFCSWSCHLRWYRAEADKRVLTRFWSKVNKNGPVPEHRPDLGPCWVWTGSLGRRGYGNFTANRRLGKAHRFAYQLVYGEITPGHDICHHCDNPPCVRIDHLFSGTRAENMADMLAKGRGVPKEQQWLHRHPERCFFRMHPEAILKGEDNPHAKLRDQDIRDMRDLRASGMTFQAIAAKFGVAYQTVIRIVQRKAWKHVD